MDKTERARLRALCEAATEGPWFLDGGGICCGVSQGTSWRDRGVFVTDDTTRADGDFIATARTALPAALDALDAMEDAAEETWHYTAANMVKRDLYEFALGKITQLESDVETLQEERDALENLNEQTAAERDELRAKLNAVEARLEAELADIANIERHVAGVEKEVRRATVEAIVRRLRAGAWLPYLPKTSQELADLIEREFLTEKGGV